MPYFINLAPGCRIFRCGSPAVDLTSLPSEATCLRLYLQGFSYIGVTPQAVEILKKAPEITLEKLIEMKKKERKTQEIQILKEALELKKSSQKNAGKLRKT